jgi:hypothetical protein
MEVSGANQFFYINHTEMSTVSLIGGLDDRGSIPSKGKDSSLFHSAQTSSGAHPASYPMVTEGSISGGKAAGTLS